MVTRLAVYATLLLMGCAGNYRSGAYPEPGVYLHVENYNWSDATIYVARSSSRMRVGHVRSNSKATLRVPFSYTSQGTLELWIRFVGSNAVLATPPMPVARGQHIEVILRNYIPFSSVIPLAVLGSLKVAETRSSEHRPSSRARARTHSSLRYCIMQDSTFALCESPTHRPTATPYIPYTYATPEPLALHNRYYVNPKG